MLAAGNELPGVPIPARGRIRARIISGVGLDGLVPEVVQTSPVPVQVIEAPQHTLSYRVADPPVLVDAAGQWEHVPRRGPVHPRQHDQQGADEEKSAVPSRLGACQFALPPSSMNLL